MNVENEDGLFPADGRRADVLDCFVFLVRPGLARRLLVARRVHGRPLDEGAVARFADDMRAGRWRLNGQPLVFDRTGRLVDGRRRLAAVLRADVGVRFLVVRGVDPGTAVTLDQGEPRDPDAAASLARAAGLSASPLAAALQLLAKVREGDPTSAQPPSATKLFAVREASSSLRKSLVEVSEDSEDSKFPWGASLVPLAVAHHLASHDHAHQAGFFFDALRAPPRDASDDPQAILRERLSEREHGCDARSDGELLVTCLTSWLAWRDRGLGSEEEELELADDRDDDEEPVFSAEDGMPTLRRT